MTYPGPSTAAEVTGTASPRIRLHYLDGLRGLAALYVVMHHAMMDIDPNNTGAGLPMALIHLTRWLIYGYGQSAVDVFIVLSGYCLMLPVARSSDGLLRGGVKDFLVRRARRILPPYYAALVLFTVVIWRFPVLFHLSSTRWPRRLEPNLTFHTLVSHLFLFHNLKPNWAFTIDFPMWSVATEWQIYFLFPLLLILYRRWGVWAPVAAGLVFGAVCAEWLPQFDTARPWFVGLFAFGMAGAVAGFSSQAQWIRLRSRMPWGTIAAVFALSYCILLRLHTEFLHLSHVLDSGLHQQITADIMVGIATASFLIFCTRHHTDHSNAPMPVTLRICSSAPAVGLGIFSYSLYLVHAPIIALVHDIAGHFHASSTVALLVVMGIGIPLSIAVSYGFHRVFERPFMHLPQ